MQSNTAHLTAKTEPLLARSTHVGAALAVAALVAAAWVAAGHASHDKLVAATAVKAAPSPVAVTLPRVEVIGFRDRQVAAQPARNPL